MTINRYADIIYFSILDHYFDSEFVCTAIGVCSNHYYTLSADDFAREVLKDKPEIVEEPSFSSKKPLKVLQLSDMHIDPKYKENSEADCGQPACCRDRVENPKKPAGKWGTLASCDLPIRTVEKMIEQIASEINPDMILWTGDNDTHDVWKLHNNTASEATHILGKILYNNLVNITKAPLFPALGNHEEKTVDIFNPYNLSMEKPLLDNITEVYKLFIEEAQAKEFNKQGYYTAKHADTNLRIIALNPFLCDSVNFYLIRDPTDPLHQIDFLRKTLDEAEKSGEKVFVIGHIPPQISYHLNECTKRYNVIMERYRNIVRGQFYGHTHQDENKVIKGYFNRSDNVGNVFIAPSTTTYSELNPSFRVYEVDPETWYMKNLYQYRLNLTDANLHPEKELKWTLAYDFNSLYETKHLHDFDKLMENFQKIKTDKQQFQKILKEYYTNGPSYEKNKDSEKKQRSFWCSLTSDSFEDSLRCSSLGSSFLGFISNTLT
eukprot:CAMPEP_0170539930 /NCGR_PEP_ID=MMETSP0209-20121228/104313_1 /TAXON_ID=665100 ORGANISM="Litonotus pictus, Strain P1" /NCGR_SAMPLE_ID=MMETSP0209 /ASSEMBLY_ACC=CAM_ASM_000301 /LENGTH=490 /DNA_ID=CAMNT_0010842137 /DNA_START=739 /DNA_END=2208 /DNA_ORIENTATION=+